MHGRGQSPEHYLEKAEKALILPKKYRDPFYGPVMPTGERLEQLWRAARFLDQAVATPRGKSWPRAWLRRAEVYDAIATAYYGFDESTSRQRREQAGAEDVALASVLTAIPLLEQARLREGDEEDVDRMLGFVDDFRSAAENRLAAGDWPGAMDMLDALRAMSRIEIQLTDADDEYLRVGGNYLREVFWKAAKEAFRRNDEAWQDAYFGHWNAIARRSVQYFPPAHRDAVAAGLPVLAKRVLEIGIVQFPGQRGTELKLMMVEFLWGGEGEGAILENLEELHWRLEMLASDRPNDVQTQFQWGYVCLMQYKRGWEQGVDPLGADDDHFRAAATAFSRVLERHPNEPATLTNLVYLYGLKLQRIVEFSSRLAKEAPDDPGSSSRLTEIDPILAETLREGFPIFVTMEQRSPDDAIVLRCLVCYYDIEDDDHLVRVFQERLAVVESGGTNRESYFAHQSSPLHGSEIRTTP